MLYNSMPIFMEPFSPSNTAVASEDDDITEIVDDETDYSFSFSGLPEGDDDADPASPSREFEDSVSFSFSVASPFDTECGMLGFAESSALVTCEHAETTSVCHNSETCSGGRHVAAHTSGKHDVKDDDGHDDMHGYNGNHRNVLDDQDALCNHGNADNNVRTYSGNDGSHHDDRDMFGKHVSHDFGMYAEHEHARRALSANSMMRFAGQGMLQPWRSSKLSSSCGHEMRQGIDISPGTIHSSQISSTTMQESSDSEVFSPRGNSLIKGVGSPTHVSLYMPTSRRNSALFARGDALPFLLHAQKHSAAYNKAALSLPSEGSACSSSYRTSSTISTQSSGYSSSSGKSSTPASRKLSRNETNARCSLPQMMHGETHTQEQPHAHMHIRRDPRAPLQRKGDPIAHLQRKEDPNAQVHRKGDLVAHLHRKGNPSGHMCKEGDLCKYYLHTQARSRVKSDPFAIGQHGVTSLSSSSASLTPCSPVSWRSVFSLQPFNPSHVPVDEWEILGKPSSRSNSQRSNSRRSNVMSAGLSNSKQKNSRKRDAKPRPQKMVKRRRYWALNPMHWFRHCRKEKQVVDTGNLDSEKQRSSCHSGCQ